MTGGQIDEWAEPGEYRGRACSVVVKPAGVEHENRVSGEGARTLTIQAAPESSIDRQIRQRPWGWFEKPDVVRAAVALMRDRSRTYELLAAVLSSPTPGIAIPAWLPKVKAILHERFDEHLRFAEIAEEVGLHPVYLSRAFHHHAGSSMSEYVRALQRRGGYRMCRPEVKHVQLSPLSSS